MDMGVDDDVHVFRPGAGFGQPVQETGLEAVQEGDLRPLAAIADPGVDENGLAVAAQHPGLHCPVQGIGVRMLVVGREP
jgi:hypothetical protein